MEKLEIKIQHSHQKIIMYKVIMPQRIIKGSMYEE